MRKRILILLGTIVVIAAGALLRHGSEKTPSPTPLGVTTTSAPPTDYKNATYTINGQDINLVNGHAETDIDPGSASKTITQYFGNEATGDLTGSGTADVAFIITQTSGGTGTFYYIVAALKTPTGDKGTNGVYLGDRIAPQKTEIRNGEIIVNYADRRANEPMAAQPSVGVSKYLRLENGALEEVAK